MASGSSDLESPFGSWLTTHFCEIWCRWGDFLVIVASDHGLQRGVTQEVVDGFLQRCQGDHRHRGEGRRFKSVGCGKEHFSAALSVSQIGDGQASPNGAFSAVEA